MKRFLTLLILVSNIAFNISAPAQIGININIGSQPAWGPTGYDHVDYYYFPDIDAYYNVPKRQYVYLNKNQWVFTNSLPYKYSGFDPYRRYKVVINRPAPYKDGDMYRNKYAGFSDGRGPKQESIRDSKDEKYKNHPGNKGHKEKDRNEKGNKN